MGQSSKHTGLDPTHRKTGDNQTGMSSIRKSVVIIIIVLVLILSGVALSLYHKSSPPNIPVVAQNNTTNESVVWNTSSQFSTTANVTSFFHYAGKSATNSSFTLGVSLTAKKAVGPENSFSAFIDVSGLISRSFDPTRLSVGVYGWAPNDTYYFTGLDLYGIYEPVPSLGWFRINTSSDFSPLSTVNANQTNSTLYTYATLQNASSGSKSSPYLFSFPIRLAVYAGALSPSVVGLRYFATLEGVKANVSAYFTIMMSVNQ